MSFMKTLIGKNLGQIRKSVNPIGCLKRASDKQRLSMRKPALVRRKTACNIYEGVDRGGGGTGVEGAESGVEGAESGVEGAGSGGRGGGEPGKIGAGN